MSRSFVEIDERFVPQHADHVYAVDVDGEYVILDESVGRLHLLNHTGSLLWQLFDGSADVGELARDVSDVLGADYDTVLADTILIVGRLRREGLIRDMACVEPPSRSDSP
jgi:hypothetical protein